MCYANRAIREYVARFCGSETLDPGSPFVGRRAEVGSKGEPERIMFPAAVSHKHRVLWT